MNIIRRPEIKDEIDPGEVPIGSILWFVGTQRRLDELTGGSEGNGRWMVCDGRKIELDPSNEEQLDLFRALGGFNLSAYLETGDSTYLNNVSPLLSYQEKIIAFNGFNEFYVQNKYISGNQCYVAQVYDEENDILKDSLIKIDSCSFESLVSSSLTGSTDKWVVNEENSYEWNQNLFSLTWPQMMFNSLLGLTTVAGKTQVWDEETGASGSFIDENDIGQERLNGSIYPYSLAKLPYGRENIEHQEAMESAFFKNIVSENRRQGPFYVASSYIEEKSKTLTLLATDYSTNRYSEKFAQLCRSYEQDVSKINIFNHPEEPSFFLEYDKTLRKLSLNYKNISNGTTSTLFWWEGVNNLKNLDDMHSTSCNIGVINNVLGYDYLDTEDNTANISQHMFVKCTENPDKVVRHYYLGDVIDRYEDEPELFEDNYDKWFTTHEYSVDPGGVLPISSYIKQLSGMLYKSSVNTGTTFQGSIRGSAAAKDNVLKVLTFIADHIVVEELPPSYRFTVPDIKENESIAGTRQIANAGIHTDGGLPNLNGYFTGRVSGDGKLFKRSGNGTTGGIADYSTSNYKVTFNASNFSKIYSNNNTGVYPAGILAIPIMRVR